MRVLGLDGFKKGWVVVEINDKQRNISFHTTITHALSDPFDRALVDIPIGLPLEGSRKCDEEARQVLGAQWKSVFIDARRELWESGLQYDELNSSLSAANNRMISKQLWSMREKIKEVDDFVLRNKHLTIMETHPELVFLRLNGNEPLSSKKSAAGIFQRMELLKSEFPLSEGWLGANPLGKKAGMDDVLDACACAIAARDMSGCLPVGKTLPDKYDLPMQIWY